VLVGLRICRVSVGDVDSLVDGDDGDEEAARLAELS
jgi:hypothetical protein